MNLLLSLLVALLSGLLLVGAPKEAFTVAFWLACGAAGWNLGAAFIAPRRAR